MSCTSCSVCTFVRLAKPRTRARAHTRIHTHTRDRMWLTDLGAWHTAHLFVLSAGPCLPLVGCLCVLVHACGEDVTLEPVPLRQLLRCTHTHTHTHAQSWSCCVAALRTQYMRIGQAENTLTAPQRTRGMCFGHARQRVSAYMFAHMLAQAH